MPAPEGPISASRCGRRSFFHIASISSSRPTKKSGVLLGEGRRGRDTGAATRRRVVRSVTSSSARESAAARRIARWSRCRATALRSTARPRRVASRGGCVVDAAPDRLAGRRGRVRPPAATISASTTPAENTSARASTARRAPARAPCRPACRPSVPPRARTQRARDAEVHHHDAPGAGEHHVLGLDVAVHEPGGVDRLEPGEELRGDLRGPPAARAGSARAARSASVTPSTYSIDTSSRPSSSTRSKTRQTLGETTSRAARTSWRRPSSARSLGQQRAAAPP